MRQPTTEKLPEGQTIDRSTPLEAVYTVLKGQQDAISIVAKSALELERGAEVMAGAIRSGRSLIYAAAGSSGLMALADASELPGTFGLSPDRIRIHMAGGVPVDGHMPGDTEDDTEAANNVVRDVENGDVVIVLSASGTTPYALAVARCAKAKGGKVIALANNPDTALLNIADVSICLETPPEAIAGSTRLGAGTAQKAALNTMSTLMGVRLGHVYQGLMVNVVADNAKLIKRAAGIVAHIAGTTIELAESALGSASGSPKAAILIAKGCDRADAARLLALHDGHLGPCLQSISRNGNDTEFN